MKSNVFRTTLQVRALQGASAVEMSRKQEKESCKTCATGRSMPTSMLIMIRLHHQRSMISCSADSWQQNLRIDRGEKPVRRSKGLTREEVHGSVTIPICQTTMRTKNVMRSASMAPEKQEEKRLYTGSTTRRFSASRKD